MIIYFEIASGTEAYKKIDSFIRQDQFDRSFGDLENALGLNFVLDLGLFEKDNYYLAARVANNIASFPLKTELSRDLKNISLDSFKEKLGHDYKFWSFVSSPQFCESLLSNINQ